MNQKNEMEEILKGFKGLACDFDEFSEVDKKEAFEKIKRGIKDQPTDQLVLLALVLGNQGQFKEIVDHIVEVLKERRNKEEVR